MIWCVPFQRTFAFTSFLGGSRRVIICTKQGRRPEPLTLPLTDFDQSSVLWALASALLAGAYFACFKGFGWASPVVQQIKNLLAMQEILETWIRFQDQKAPLEEKMATHSSILA